MAFDFLLIIFAFLNHAFAGSHAALCDEAYWRSVFPNTPMPKALKDLLSPADPSKEFKGINSHYINAPDSHGPYKELTAENPYFNINYFELKSLNDPDSEKVPSSNYGDEAPGGKEPAINETIYFLQKDLHAGTKVKLSLLVKPRGMRTFLPHRVAESMPFSSDKLPEILKHYSIKAESEEANTMNETIINCERAAIDGEDKYCATSLKSFVDLSVSRLGNNIKLLASEVGKETRSPLFSIGRGMQHMGEEEIVCHKMQYPYAVFLCHSINRASVYKVPFVGLNGKEKANALAVCHKDTSAWNSPRLPFPCPRYSCLGFQLKYYCCKKINTKAL